MTDIHLELFTPLIEMQDSLDSARITKRYATVELGRALCRDYRAYIMWRQRSAWHLANAIGWASRD